MSSTVVTRLAELALLGKHEAGIDRALATPQERAARERFANWANSAGRSLSQDAVGNLFARRTGSLSKAAPILVGSHLDTVATGGAYDGAYGVVSALCALEVLDESRIATAHPIDAVAWVGEEGSRFPLGCLGSSVFSGLRPLEDALALTDAAGISLREALADPRGGLLSGVALRESEATAAYVELHVEQGPVLERAEIAIGIVTAIAGQRRYRVIVEGTSGHAGTVPMEGRADALCAAADIVLALERAARDVGESVATVGRMLVEPGGTNVIPARVDFSVDVRSGDDARINAIHRALYDAGVAVEESRGVRVRVSALETRMPTPMNQRMRRALHRAVDLSKQRAMDIPSGAGHDAMCLAAIAPSAMIFVPSIGGRSHVGEERTAPGDLELGVEILAAAIVEVDRVLAAN